MKNEDIKKINIELKKVNIFLYGMLTACAVILLAVQLLKAIMG